MWSPLKRVRGLLMEVYDVILLNVIIWIPLESRLGSLRQKTLTPTVNDPNSRNSWRLKRFVFHGFLFYRLLHNFITWWSFFSCLFCAKKNPPKNYFKNISPLKLMQLELLVLTQFLFCLSRLRKLFEALTFMKEKTTFYGDCSND